MLDTAIITAPDLWPEDARARLATLCPRIFG
jgi:hypothetical protein